ncbi:conserved hypothetical protein [Talaromyces stipitatus ATCC 10500]|uniref:Integrase catalytic domain-containing protein n=1 Tax=Talaromyces stipitatus (strain ATCC 10500 / CBS 375.48 / QM 6759 / NRRL 1006) TaxID=441959 RepID=B8LXD4_TALSN|nr:uncharacterized protein TSTA_066610 [Talaromyces stipitatus ATCC 10500]EED23215.1 conserved hypothetical protein [Talaromyces stipitatus ATCC 10500]
MFARNANNAATEQFLSVPSDWEKWEKVFRAKMEQKDLLEYLKGKKDLMQKPEMPDNAPTFPTLENLRARNGGQENEPSSQTEDGSTSQQIPTIATAAERAALKAWKEDYKEELAHFNLELGLHRTKMTLYETERKHLDEVAAWMQSTVSNDLKETCLGEGIDVRSGYENLKKFFGRTVMTIAHELGDQYKKHMKPFQQWPKDTNTWVSGWLTLMQKGNQHNLSFATDPINWTKDFFEAFYKIDASWVTTIRTMYSGKIEDKTVTYLDFSRQLQEHSRLKNQTTSRGGFQRGAFNTNHDHDTRSDEEDREDNNKDNDKESGQRKRKGNKNYQPARASSGPACIGCGQRHSAYRCFYLFPDLAPSRWKPNPEIKAITEKNLQDKKIREEVEDMLKRLTSTRLNEIQKMNNKKGKNAEDFYIAIQASFTATGYILYWSAILDSGSTIHVFHDIYRFENYRVALPGDFLWAGKSKVKIEGYGEVVIQIRGQNGKSVPIRLYNVAYCKDFATNLVSMQALWKMGYYWDQRPSHHCLRRNDGRFVGYIQQRHGQFTGRNPRKADIQRWHLRLGHPGPQALEHLANASRGVRITGLSSKTNLKKGEGIKTVECDACGTSKAKRQISRVPRQHPDKPGERIALDFHDFEPSTLSQYSSVMLVTDRYSGYIWDYNLTDRTAETILAALKDLLGRLDAQYGIILHVVECDNEIYMKRFLVRKYLEEDLFIRIEPSPPHTQALNGAGERSGGVIKDKGRGMAASRRLTQDLWPEINRCAVYLYNRTPRYESNWKTPYEVFHTYLALQNGKVFEDMKPNQAHLRVYGCKVYSLTTKYMKKEKRLQRYHPKAWIGFLVGYDSTNIFHIWNPKLGVVVSARDVIFNEDEVFDGNVDKLRNDLATTTIDEIAELLNSVQILNDDFQSTTVGGPSWTRDDEPILNAKEEGLNPRIDVKSNSRIVEAEENAHLRVEGKPLDAHLRVEGKPFDAHLRVEGKPDIDLRVEGLTGAPTAAGTDARVLVEDEAIHPDGINDIEKDIPYPTPPDSPPAALMSATIQNPVKEELSESSYLDTAWRKVTTWEAAFYTGTCHKIYGSRDGKPFNRSSLRRILRSTTGLQVFYMDKKPAARERIKDILDSGKELKNLHRNMLPAPPKRHEDLKTHELGELFLEAEKDHLRSHKPTNSWSKVPSYYAKGRQVLDCMWVYVYKFDKHGRLAKCKARIVVRGDQQVGLHQSDTYAATLAARSFRTFMVIAARFDLEMLQYDVVNAFVHAPIQETVFMRIPPGYRHLYPGQVLKLNKALYGLRTSPLQWQKTLTESLWKLGFKSVPHEPCCMLKNGILIFFYVDDIVLAYKKGKEYEAKGLMEDLKKEYTITGGEDLQWFLGICILRDREKRLIWLSQASYIDKIIKLADSQPIHETPMKKEELLPYDGRASPASIHSYQRKVGSLMYAAVSTRIDIAFAVSRLSRFLINPSPSHHLAADRVLLYLQDHRHFALQLGGGDDFTVASDASFADNSLDRKSSQAYVMTLYGGVTGWQANKQNTVTTSTIEAELLALSQAAKEGIYVMRLLKELDIKLESPILHLECDNQQTISLIEKDIVTLKTRLRHVDIHHHWLRQEHQEGRVQVDYVPTRKMIANGLTKALGKGEFDEFLKQVGMTDVSSYIEEQKEDVQEMDIDTIFDSLQI